MSELVVLDGAKTAAADMRCVPWHASTASWALQAPHEAPAPACVLQPCRAPVCSGNMALLALRLSAAGLAAQLCTELAAQPACATV